MIAALYLLKVMLCSGILLLYYWPALHNKAFHQWNRFYLLGITALSLILPLIQVPVGADEGLNAVRYISVSSIDESIVVATKDRPFFPLSTEHWFMGMYLLISLILVIVLIKATKGILNISKSYQKQKLEHIYFLNTDVKGAPFSFLNYLIWNKDIDLQSGTGKQIFRHELAHIEQKHTLDKIFLLIVLIPYWINPFFWIIRKELNDIHEFLADAKALQNGTADDLSRMVLNALYPGQAYLLTSPFFQSSVKRRLHMFTIKNQKINYMSRILLLPLLFVVAAAFTIQHDSKKEKEMLLEKQAFQLPDDTLPGKSNGVMVEEIKKASVNGVKADDIHKVGKGVVADTRNKIYLESDEIIYKIHPNETTTTATNALLIINGQKLENDVWKDKTIVSKKLTVYPKEDKEAIELYGQEAAKGTLVFEGARIIDKKDSKIYSEMQKDTVPKKSQQEAAPVFTKAETDPVFDGNWGMFLTKHLDAAVPVNNGAPAGKYTVIAQFIVEKDGTITDLKMLTKHGYGMEEAVQKLISSSPRWKPATQNGRIVRAYKKQPITFVISEEAEQILAATEKIYIGIDNPIKLDFGKVDEKDLRLTITQGSIQQSGGYYVARINTIGTATIKVEKKENGKWNHLGSRTFTTDVIKDEKEYREKIEQQIKKFKQ